MRIAFVVCVGICALLGLVHISFTFANYDHLSPEAVWFAGTGFALILLAALNWAAWGELHPSRRVRAVVLMLDILMAAFGIVAVKAVPEPQAYVLVVVFASLGACGWFLNRGHATARR
jgi:hypothetical protein